MPLKQQILNSLGLYATRRICRIGSHNCEWVVIESDDLIELLVDGALNNSDKYWKALLRLRGLSHAFHRVVNAKLDALVAELRAKADAARAEFALLTPSPIGLSICLRGLKRLTQSEAVILPSTARMLLTGYAWRPTLEKVSSPGFSSTTTRPGSGFTGMSCLPGGLVLA